MSSKTALVMRATGSQGRATIKHLLNTGWKVHALVSDASSDRAMSVKTLGDNITLYQGTWKDPASIEAAVKECQALFLVQLPSFTDDSEKQEARTVMAIAKTAGVQHVVFPTSLPLNKPNVREEFNGSPAAQAVLNKGEVEEIVKASGLTWTLIRPGFFSTNFLPPLIYWMFPDFKDRKFVNSYGPDCVLPLVDPDDIGAFIAAAVNDPNKFASQIVTAVSENKRVDDILKDLEKAYGYPIDVVYRTPEETEAVKSNPFAASQVSLIGLDKWVNWDEVKSWGVPLTTFTQFLEKHKDDFVSYVLAFEEQAPVPTG
ncbi:hypothetical protein N0V83_000930 [Neocucurbitaria cava]|uniref:NmrA-like domain-containing protein n=1 Tax=Neocucurbitaria cava TaxID=798079 RepID=A0A9W9CSG0_9PLEO|nr:hypothetical protein N0V83_000930 [Neocucurbitaria cava]